MIFDDDALEWICAVAGVSKPRARKVLEVAREVEFDLRIANLQKRAGRKPQCRIVGSCAVYSFPSSRIVRKPESQRQHEKTRGAGPFVSAR
jgi:hypothetical protein